MTETEPQPRPLPFDLWTRGNAGEVLAGVISPLTWSLMERTLNRFFQRSLVDAGFKDAGQARFAAMFYGRVYFNVGAMYHYLVDEQGLPSRPFLRAFGGAGHEHGLPLPERPLRWRPLLRHLAAMVRESRRQRSAPDRFRAAIPKIEALAARYAEAAGRVADLSDAELVGLLDQLQSETEPYILLLNDCNNAAFASYGGLAYLCDIWCGDPSLANDLVVGLESTRTAAASAELRWIAQLASKDDARAIVEDTEPAALADALAQSPAAGPVARALGAFLAEYGHRSADELDVMVPRWAEDPAPVLALLRSYVLNPPAVSPEDVMERQQAIRQAALRRARSLLRRRLVDRLLPWKWLVFRAYLREAQRFVPLREDPKFYLLRVLLPNRRLLLELGRRLAARGLLAQAGDVFFLTGDELETLRSAPDWSQAAAGWLERAAARRLERDRWLRVEPAWALGPDGRPLGEEPPPEAPPPVLRGIGASSGVAEGTARVIRSLEEAGRMQSGDILVAPFTDPGWTPLFPLARAVVTDIGGLLSHGAIVAREQGVPAVVNTRYATRLIADGDRIRVDGNQGLVFLDGQPETEAGAGPKNSTASPSDSWPGTPAV